MVSVDSESFLAIVAVAALAALVSGLLSSRLVVPVVVLEILAGILIGPSMLDFAEPDPFIESRCSSPVPRWPPPRSGR